MKEGASMDRAILVGARVVILAGCGDSTGYDEGYDDGYAEGYNTTCDIRSTLVHGEWDNAEYTQGYNDGRRAGSADCLNSRRN